jgi:Na+:H+ antiporter, NhaA family
MEAAGGVVLLGCTLLALVWANSAWKHSYEQFLTTQVSIGFGNFFITEDRHHWINDGLMSLFFFLVGLEIKREILVGELSSLRSAALPIVAAVGGVIVPALIYLMLTKGADIGRGWAIPIATDIAFALGVLTFLGSRIPIALKVFVAALAIVDDIIAVVVIAVFYTNQINYVSLTIGLACILLSFMANVLGVRKPLVYAVIGILAWCAVLNSGVHATIAGILLAFTIPARTILDKSQFLEQGRLFLDELELSPPNSSEQHAIIHTWEQKLVQADSPLHRIEQRLQPWISFFVMPLFALANAGVNVSGYLTAAIRHPLSLGIGLGLVIGKPAGIWLCSALAVKTRLALPLAHVSAQQILGCGCLCGIGFTMSLFVAGLAFGEGESLAISKIAILGASFASAVLGGLLLASKPNLNEEQEKAIAA